MWDAHSSALFPLLRLQGVRAAAGSPLRLFWPVRGLPQLPLLPELLVFHVVGAPVRHPDERRGLHCHLEGGCDGTQHPAAAHTLDHACFRYDLICHSWSAHYYCDTNCLALCLNLEMLLNEHNVLKLKERGYCHLCLKKNYRYCCLISLGIGWYSHCWLVSLLITYLSNHKKKSAKCQYQIQIYS